MQSIEWVAYEKYGRVLNPHGLVAKLAARDRRVEELEADRKKLEASSRWRIGHAVARAPRKLLNLVRRKKEK